MKHAILNEVLYIQVHYNPNERHIMGTMADPSDYVGEVKTEYVLDKNGSFSWSTLPKFLYEKDIFSVSNQKICNVQFSKKARDSKFVNIDL